MSEVKGFDPSEAKGDPEKDWREEFGQLNKRVLLNGLQDLTAAEQLKWQQGRTATENHAGVIDTGSKPAGPLSKEEYWEYRRLSAEIHDDNVVNPNRERLLQEYNKRMRKFGINEGWLAEYNEQNKK